MKHKLLIEDLDKLSEDIWQYPDLLPTVEKFNYTLSVWVKELNKLYNQLEGLEEPLDFDTYLLGDVINLLGVIKAVDFGE